MTPVVLDCGNEIILANWPADKHIISSINNDIPIEIPNIHTYWSTEAYFVIVVLKQIITIYLNLWLHAMVVEQS